MNAYSPRNIEQKWQKHWEETGLYKTPEGTKKEHKMYILPQLPYPSGSGLHMGHVAVYMPCDVYARYQRMLGKKVLQVVGWDSFGLPAENYAIKTNVHPKESTKNAINNFRSQIKNLGVSVDWDREVGSHESSYYKWTQWFFLLMYKRGLAYRKKQAINWCDSCKTVLANAQVEDGTCERCGTVVVQKDMDQWYLKITDYADKLLEGLDRVDWPEETVKRQKDWIGRSEGAELYFKIKKSDKKITVFTTRPDTLFGATYIVLAPEHEFVQSLKESIANFDDVQAYVEATALKNDLDRQIEQEKTGVELKGVKAINPVNGEEMSFWIADYVLASYGTGAIMAVPAHDERDFAFAKKFHLPIKQVVHPMMATKNVKGNERIGSVLKGIKNHEGFSLPITSYGQVINSEFLNGLQTEEAREKMMDWLEENNFGKRKVQYKLRDWSISRQRFWGAPLPMLYDEKGELHPVPEEDLPVILPDDVDFKPTGDSPLNYSKSFHEGVEEKYGKGWRREVDTLDTFMCSSWYFFRYLDPKNDAAFASPEALKSWMPVDFYIGGPEHVNGHLLYARFFTKVLFDAGYIDFDEPFKVHKHQGLILGPDNKKMSKRWGNVVNPIDVVEEYGADTARMYQLFMGPLEDTKSWNEGGVKGVQRFLEKVWKLQEILQDEDVSAVEKEIHKLIKHAGFETAELRFNTAIAKMMEFVNAVQKVGAISKRQLGLFVIVLAPYGPHISEEIWQALGATDSVTTQDWPEFDESLTVEKRDELIVQVNGKLRAKISVESEVLEEQAKELALAEENVQKWIDGKEIKKVIFVKGKLISFVV